MMKAFSSVDKAKVRQEDLYLIAELSRKADRKLTYLGLPSPWMGDVGAWKPYLSQVFAVENEKRYLPHLMDTAYGLGLVNQVKYFLGDIDGIMESQVDEYGRSTIEIFPVDLINLDYCRGLDYHGFSKLSTLDVLMVRQKESLVVAGLPGAFPYFLIFLTHNLPSREGDPTAKRKYIQYLTRDATYYDESLRRQIQVSRDWHSSEECPSAYPHKCFVMGRLFESARRNGFKAVPKKIIQYSGDKDAQMLHYQFQITPVSLGSPVPVDNKLSAVDIMNYPVLNAAGECVDSGHPIISLSV